MPQRPKCQFIDCTRKSTTAKTYRGMKLCDEHNERYLQADLNAQYALDRVGVFFTALTECDDFSVS